MEEFLEAHGGQADASGWFHFHRTTYTYAAAGRRQEPEQEEEKDAVAAALAPHVDPHYGDRRWHTYHHSYYRPPPPPPISSQQSRSRRPRSPSPAGRSNKRACVPASNKAIVGLKEVALTSTDDCAICLKALADGRRPADQEGAAAASETTPSTTTLRAMPCSHVFHQHCIFQWLRRNAVCPLCRQHLTTTGDDEDEEEEVEEDDDEDEDEEDSDDDEEEEEDMGERRLPDWLRVFLEGEEQRQLQRLADYRAAEMKSR